MILPSPVGSGVGLGQYLENMRTQVNRSAELTAGKDLAVTQHAGGRRIEFVGKAGAVASKVSMFAYTAMKDDYVEARQVNPVTLVVSEQTVNIAKPWHLRKTPWDARSLTEDTIPHNGTVTFDAANFAKRVLDVAGGAGKRTQYVVPSFNTGTIVEATEEPPIPAQLNATQSTWPDIIYAAKVEGGTGVEVTPVGEIEPEQVVWQDMNVDARDWVTDNALVGTEVVGTVHTSGGDDNGKTAQTDTWDVKAQDSGEAGFTFNITTRVAFDHVSDSILYGFMRAITIDVLGRILTVGLEVRYIIDDPVNC